VQISDWTIDHSRARNCKRWSVYPGDVIDLTVAEMDLPTAEPVLAAVREAVDRQSFGYPVPDTSSDLPELCATWLADDGLEVPPAQVRIASDIIKALVNAIRYFTPDDSPVAVITPTYSRFLDAVEAAGRRTIQVPMTETGAGYTIDCAALEEAFKFGAGSLLLCNPSNPTGRLFSRSELVAVSEVAARYRVRVFSDEVHAPIRYERLFTPYASTSPEAARHSITFTSVSKAWNVPGLRCALVVFTNPEDNDRWNRIPRASKGGISPLGMVATAAAITAGQPWLDEARAVLRTNRDIIADSLGRAGLSDVLHVPEATYLAWLDLRGFGLDDPQAVLLDQAGIATTPGLEHGAAGDGFVRLNFATPTAVVQESMDRLLKLLAGSVATGPVQAAAG
jgi:cystathionine beta-lyase